MGTSFDYFAIGNDELKDLPDVKKGDLVKCKICKKEHKLKCGKCEDGHDSDLLFYKCSENNKCYLAGVSGKLLNL